MSLRLVRCPFCGKRFNIAGVAAGTHLKCSGCSAVLSVPQTQRFDGAAPATRSRRPLLIAGGIGLAVVVTAAVVMALRPAPRAETKALETAALPAPAVQDPKKPPEKTPRPFFDPAESLLIAKQSIIDEFGPDRMRFREARPFLIAVERSERFVFDDVIRDYSAALDVLYGVFRRHFAETFELREVDEVLTVIVLHSRESYEAYYRRTHDGGTLSPELRGLYEPTAKRVVLYHDQWVPFEVILHEGVHHLVHYYTRRLSKGETKAYWFHEGLATYFETFPRKGGSGEVVPDPGINRQRLNTIKLALQDPSKMYLPLKVLVGMSIDEFWGWFREEKQHDEVLATRRAQAAYAEAWALVYFLRTKGGNYRRAFDEYFRLELQGKGGKETFEAVIREHLDRDLETLEKEFAEYIRILE